MTKEETGSRIHLIREMRRLSQFELAELLHTTQPKVSQMEGGLRNISFEDMCRLAEVLHFSLDAFCRTGPNGFEVSACLLPVPRSAAYIG